MSLERVIAGGALHTYSNGWLPNCGDIVEWVHTPPPHASVLARFMGTVIFVDRKLMYFEVSDLSEDLQLNGLWSRWPSPNTTRVIQANSTRHYRRHHDPPGFVPHDGDGMMLPVPAAPSALYRPAPTLIGTPQQIAAVKEALSGGMSCKRCNMRNDYAAANQADGSYLCYNCR